MSILRFAAPLALAAALAGCSRSGELDLTSGVGVTAIRTACPVVGLPAGTGDITLFDPPARRDSAAIDVVATLSNLRGDCADVGEEVTTTLTFEVRGRRTRTDGAREVVLPYFVSVVRGGSQVVSKHVGRVALRFEPGQAVASATGQATATVNRAAATLPDDVRRQLTRRRKPGDQDAALDPLTTPEVRQAVLNATFEALVGFQLTQDQLRYNVTR